MPEVIGAARPQANAAGTRADPVCPAGVHCLIRDLLRITASTVSNRGR